MAFLHCLHTVIQILFSVCLSANTVTSGNLADWLVVDDNAFYQISKKKIWSTFFTISKRWHKLVFHPLNSQLTLQ